MRILLSMFFAFVLSVGIYGQTLAGKEKADGSIDFSRIQLNADLSQYVDVSNTRFSGAENNVNFSEVNIRFDKLNGISVDARDSHGIPTFISGDIARLPVGFTENNSGEEVIRYLRKLEENKETNFSYYGLNLSGLRLIGQSKSETHGVHYTYQQFFDDIPVYGAEVRLHFDGENLYAINGVNYEIPEPQIVSLNAHEALNLAYASVQREMVEIDTFYVKPDKVELLYYTPSRSEQLRLCYKVEIYPLFNEAWQLFVDARTGAIIEKLNTICKLTLADGPATATAEDLNGVRRTIHTYEINNQFYLIDGSRPMFIPSADILNDPKGAIWTLNAGNTFPSNPDVSLSQIYSSNNQWGDRIAVSAHFNAQQSYEYYKNTFGRNSIDGAGGTIISVINVSDEDGSGLDNAFWNGRIMWYGNGGTYFKPLAGGLDVGGHEMTHGVIEATANLEYRDESGAINEALADVFGSMIERDNWQIGEDIVKPSFGAPALRDMANPHNGGSSINDLGYQPAHYNERYTGTTDNGGVHINSGIVNHAYYLFAEEIGKKKAEQVFYHALVNYLGVRSGFTDLRASVEQSCLDLYSVTEKNAAIQAFSSVGIGGGGDIGKDEGNTYDLNPGNDWVYVINSRGNLELYTGAGDFIAVVDPNIIARTKPSVTDNGTVVVYVTDKGEIYYHILKFATDISIVAQGVLIDNSNGEWGNVTISRDGRYIAFVSNYADKTLYVADILESEIKAFELYNPTRTEGVKTGDVKYADAVEFHHDGQRVFYDAYNEVEKTNGSNISYWNIGVIKVIDRTGWASGEINSILGTLAEGVSIGNPSLSRNSDGYLAVDIVEENFFGADYSLGIIHIYDNVGYVISQNSVLSFPSFNRLDNLLILSAMTISNDEAIALGELNSDLTGFKGDLKYFSDGKMATWFADGERSLTTAERISINDNISVFPNPVTDYCTVALDEKLKEETRLNLYTSNGVLLETYKLTPGQKSIDVPMQGRPAGVYFMKMFNAEGNLVFKLIKQ